MRLSIKVESKFQVKSYEAHDAYINARNHITDLLLTAGHLNTGGKVDLNIFPKNIKGNINGEELLEKLKEQGLITKDLKNFNSSK